MRCSVTSRPIGGAAHRLNRKFGKRFGDAADCFEEACAEIGAAFLCARLDIAVEPHPDHARYIRHWLEVIKAEPRAIFAAAAKAQEAVTYLDEKAGRRATWHSPAASTPGAVLASGAAASA